MKHLPLEPLILSTPQPTIAIVGSVKEKTQFVELGFVDKLIQLWRLRRSIGEAKAEIAVSGILAKYNYKAGDAIMNKTKYGYHNRGKTPCFFDYV